VSIVREYHLYVPDIELYEARTMDEVFELFERHTDARILAGGTDLLVDLKSGRASVTSLISIKKIDSLKQISLDNGDLHIGSLTTITALNDSPMVHERFPSLIDAASRMAAPQVRNAATVGGNVVSAVPCADLPPILMALDASVVTKSSDDERTIPLTSFFQHVRQTALSPGEIVTSIIVPAPRPRSGAAYKRFSLRDGNSISVAGVAVNMQLNVSGEIESARVALGAVSPTPMLVEGAGSLLVGQKLDEKIGAEVASKAIAACRPISDVRGSADFRREIVGVLTKRALDAAWARASSAFV